MIDVAIVIGSVSDWEVFKPCIPVLKELGLTYVVRSLSAHRTPHAVVKMVNDSPAKVFIAAAGGAAHLAGVIAAHTIKPVIGVPIATVLGGLDSLLSTVQMPKGVPVATVAISGSVNAVILAAQILSVNNPDAVAGLQHYREKMRETVYEADAGLQKELARSL